MYANPELIRSHTVMLRFNDKERDLVNALVTYTGAEKAAYLRELVLAAAVQVLHETDSASVCGQLRGR